MDDATRHELVKAAYTAALCEGVVPRPVIMPFVGSELVGTIWSRPLYRGKDALTGIAELANIATAAEADEVVLAWETYDVANACELPVVGVVPCMNLVHATAGARVLYQHPYDQVLRRGRDGQQTIEPRWETPYTPQSGAELVPPIQAAIEFAFTPLKLNHPDPLAATAAYMESEGYRVRLTERFAGGPQPGDRGDEG